MLFKPLFKKNHIALKKKKISNIVSKLKIPTKYDRGQATSHAGEKAAKVGRDAATAAEGHHCPANHVDAKGACHVGLQK